MKDNKSLIIIDNEKKIPVINKKGIINFVKQKVKDNLEVSMNINKNKKSGDIGVTINLSFKDDKINKNN